MFIGKGYLNEGLFKLSVMVIDSINKNFASVYLLELSDLLHALNKHDINHLNPISNRRIILFNTVNINYIQFEETLNEVAIF